MRQETFCEISIARRATEEAIRALALHYPEVDRADLESALAFLAAATPERDADERQTLIVWEVLRKDAEERYSAAKAGNHCRRKRTETAGVGNSGLREKAEAVLNIELTPALVVEACPAVEAFGLPLITKLDLVAAGRYLRNLIGVDLDAWSEAVETIGALDAAVLLIYVGQIHDNEAARGVEMIRNPGGYFRALMRLVVCGRFNVRSELLSLRRRRMS